MAIAKSSKLLAEEAAGQPRTHALTSSSKVHGINSVESLQIESITCFGELVAIAPFEQQSIIELPDDQKYANVGTVVGVGPTAVGIVVGDVVVFQHKNVVLDNIQEYFEHYANAQVKVLLISSRSLYMKIG